MIYGNVLKDYEIGYNHLVNQEKLPNACGNLRAIAGNTSHQKIFLILCIQFVLCMDCQFMKYKGYVNPLNLS